MSVTRLRPIRTAEELLAHSIAIEREAAARYAELGERMRELGNDVVAELFLRLARLEKEHEQELKRRAAGLALPRIAPGEYAWFDRGAPETAAHDWSSIFG
jgi:rubrerythrin